MDNPRAKPTLARGRGAPADPKGLEEEIGFVRQAIKQVADQAAEVDDVKTLLRLLDSLSSASQRLAGLLRAQRTMAGEKADQIPLKKKLDDALEEIGREKNIID